MKDHERDTIRKTILSTIKKSYVIGRCPRCRKILRDKLHGAHVHWTDIRKRILGATYPFASDSSFRHQLRYLLEKGYIERVTRGVYQITARGEKYLEIL